MLQNEKGNLELGLEMLSLARGWKMTDAQQAVQNAIIASKMVDPYTLDQSESDSPHLLLRGQMLTFKQSVLLLYARNHKYYWITAMILRPRMPILFSG